MAWYEIATFRANKRDATLWKDYDKKPTRYAATYDRFGGNVTPSGHGFTSRKAAKDALKRTQSNPSRSVAKRPKLGKWIQAKRVRVVKNSAGERVLEIQRTVKKTIRRKPARRKKR